MLVLKYSDKYNTRINDNPVRPAVRMILTEFQAALKPTVSAKQSPAHVILAR
jgi:hypothetical protein